MSFLELASFIQFTIILIPFSVILLAVVVSYLAIRHERQSFKAKLDIDAVLQRMASFGYCPALLYDDMGRWQLTLAGEDEDPSNWHNTPTAAVAATMELYGANDRIIFGEIPKNNPDRSMKLFDEAVSEILESVPHMDSDSREYVVQLCEQICDLIEKTDTASTLTHVLDQVRDLKN